MAEVKPLKERISITLDADLLAQLRESADYEGLQLSTYLNMVLKKYVRSQEKPS